MEFQAAEKNIHQRIQRSAGDKRHNDSTKNTIPPPTVITMKLTLAFLIAVASSVSGTALSAKRGKQLFLPDFMMT